MSKVLAEVDSMKTRVSDSKVNIKAQAVKLEKSLATFEAQRTEKMSQIDEYFDKLLLKVTEARENLKSELTDICESKNTQMTICLNEYKKYLTKLDATKAKVEKLSQEISK